MEEQRDISAILTKTFDNVCGETFQDKLDTLSTCNCCSRHQINKPKKFSPWRELPFNNLLDESSNCKCPCRHIARFICRQHDLYEQNTNLY